MSSPNLTRPTSNSGANICFDFICTALLKFKDSVEQEEILSFYFHFVTFITN